MYFEDVDKNSNEFYQNRQDMRDGIKEIWEELFGYCMDFYILDPIQKAAYTREVKFPKYQKPFHICGRLIEDPTKKDRTDMEAENTHYQYKAYIDVPCQFFRENNISLDQDDLVRAKIRIADTDYFPYEVQILSYVFGEVLIYRFVCRYEKPTHKAVVRP